MTSIQLILGHDDITTTEIYLHVAVGAHGLGIVSPLDRLTLPGLQGTTPLRPPPA